MARSLTVWTRGFLKTSCCGPRSVSSVRFSNQSNPEEWEAVSGDLLAIHSKREKGRTVSQKRSWRPAYKAAEQRLISKPKTSLGSEHVFGLHPVLLALRARKRILYELHVDEDKLSKSSSLEHSPLLLQILDLAKEQELPVSACPQNRLNQWCAGGNHQGVCLDVSQLPVLQGEALLGSLDKSDVGQNPDTPLWLFMDRIQDPMNFGAVLRSSCYFGVQKVLVPNRDSCRLSPTVSKASSGALELMDLYVLKTPEQFIVELKGKGWWIVGTSSFNDSTRHASDSGTGRLTWDLPPPDRPVLLIVGNEGQGIQPELSALCDTVLCVAPLREDNPIGSLNVSVATGIVLHHVSLSRRS